MSAITIEITLKAGQKIEPDQVEKFVEESLHLFQKQLSANSAERDDFRDFCESGREYKTLCFCRQIPTYETSSDPSNTFQLSGYSDLPSVHSQPPFHKNQTQSRNRNLRNQIVE